MLLYEESLKMLRGASPCIIKLARATSDVTKSMKQASVVTVAAASARVFGAAARDLNAV